MKLYLLISVILLSGCSLVKDPCLMNDKHGNVYKVSSDGKVERTNGLANFKYARCNP